VAATSITAVRADSWTNPAPAVFAAEHGSYAVKRLCERPWTSARLVLFRLNDAGEEITVWTRDLLHVPHRLLVSDRGWVVGVDEWGRLGYNHALVVWDPSGKQVADYRLEQLLSPGDIREHCAISTSSRRWATDARFRFEHQGRGGSDAKPEGHDRLVMTLSWGQRLTFDLRTGALVAPETQTGDEARPRTDARAVREQTPVADRSPVRSEEAAHRQGRGG
jgi:hypothetical protein